MADVERLKQMAEAVRQRAREHQDAEDRLSAPIEATAPPGTASGWDRTLDAQGYGAFGPVGPDICGGV